MTTTDVTLQDMFSSLGNVTNDSENSTVSPGQLVADPMTLNVPYTVCEVLVATCAVIGNALVIVVFRRERRLRRRTNYYIVSLAVADFLVGLVGIPAALLASVGHPHHLHACLFTVSLLVVLCTISIFCLVAVSVDRYWAILHPMAYSRNVRTKTAIAIISGCWALGSLVGFLPLLGWHQNFPDENMQCFFTKVMTDSYLVSLYVFTIIFPALLLAAFYAHIYRVVLRQLRQIVTMNPSPQGRAAPNPTCTRHVGGAGTMLRVLGAAQKREVKATQNLSIIVLFFVICWVPLYTINFIQAFCKDCVIHQTITNLFIILSHLNSAGNPLLYAYHLRDFRAALKHLLYGIFGIQDESVNITNDFMTTRPPYGSQNALQQQAVHNNSINNSLQSLGDISLPNKRGSLTGGKYRHIYSDSPVMKDRFLLRGLSSTTLENRSMIASTVNGVYRAATLPMSTTIGRFDITRDQLQPRKQIWTLTEVSSGVENDTYSVNRNEDLEPPCEPRVRRRSVRGRAGSQSDSIDSGRVNSAYIGDEAFEDFGFVDDDVFISDAILTAYRPRSADGLETRFHLNANENSQENVSPVVENSLAVRERLGSKNILKSVSSSNFNDVPVVEASDPRDMEEHASRFVHTVEAEIYSSNVDDDRAELSPCRWNNLVIKSAVNKHCNGTNNLQKPRSGKIVRPNSAIDPGENKRTLPTSPTEVKLSPLKLVGEFLFSGKGVRTKDEANDASASTGSDTSLIACCEKIKLPDDSVVPNRAKNGPTIGGKVENRTNVT